MSAHQRTIAATATLSGVGLHSGEETTITFHPAPENSGFLFVRTDIKEHPEIPVRASAVVDTQRGTTLSNEEGVQIQTVEHVLSALAGLQIDNCRMEIDGAEPPVIDGSSEPFVKALKKVGVETQQAFRSVLVVDKPVRFSSTEHRAEFTLLPGDHFSATVILEYGGDKMPIQEATIANIYEEYQSDIASARTFCFLSEVEALREYGLIRGGSIDNAIVIADNGMNAGEIEQAFKAAEIDTDLADSNVLVGDPLRFPNEPARHKLLDLIGDLSLLGVPIQGHLVALRPSHAANVEFAQYLAGLAAEDNLVKKAVPSEDEIVMDINSVMNVLPHRYPFLLVDKIIGIDKEEGRIIGLKNVTINEPFFKGHFPGFPIMPGVLIVEAMAQTGGMLLMNEIEGDGSRLAVFMGIRDAKFRKPVVPGDTMEIEVSRTGKRFNTYTLEGKAKVGGKVVAQAEFSVAVVDQSEKS